ncbi:unnamed protein product [Amoebophrya sp. A25]|nr:unnamed protein product [Amoebophrya sp. A25]|eukprot:GSA25T00004222001.1
MEVSSARRKEVLAAGENRKSAKDATKPVAALLQFQLLLYCNGYFAYMFLILTFVLLMYKKSVFDYASGRVEREALLLFLYIPTRASRSFFGENAYRFDNPMKRNLFFVFFGFLTLPLVMFHGYWMQNQSYVLRFDEALNAMAIGLLLLEVLFGTVEAMLMLPNSRIDELSCIIRIAVVKTYPNPSSAASWSCSTRQKKQLQDESQDGLE